MEFACQVALLRVSTLFTFFSRFTSAVHCPDLLLNSPTWAGTAWVNPQDRPCVLRTLLPTCLGQTPRGLVILWTLVLAIR